MLYIDFFACLVLSGVFAAVYRRYGRRLLWATCLVAACVVLAVLFAVGEAYTSESPLWITLLALGVSTASIAAVVQVLAGRWVSASVVMGAVVGSIALYIGIFAGYVLFVYMG